MPPRNLTEVAIKSLKPAPAGQRYSVADAIVPGLKVRVTETGHKSFILWRRVVRTKASASALALGTVGQLTLAQARIKAREWIELINSGKDPRATQQTTTFGAVFEDYLRRHVAGKRKAKDVEREMRSELLVRWQHKPVTEITRRDVIKLVDEIKDRGALYQAHNIFGHAKTFFNWCIEKDIVQTSPCQHMKPTRLIGPRIPRQRVLNDDELRAFWAGCGQLGYPYEFVFKLLLLTGQRRSEVTDARWCEFNLKKKLWTVPSERFKSDSTQLVPLSADVITLLSKLPRWAGGDCLFSTDGRKPVNGVSDGKVRLDAFMGDVPPWVIHDLRRTVRTRLSSLRIPDHVSEMIIGHGRKGLQRVYDQHQYSDEMREALEAWAVKLRTIVV
jgi:integrase